MNADLLDKLLGQGTYHLVYSLKNNSQQAVKIAKGQGDQLRKEAQILTALSSTNQFPKVLVIGNTAANLRDEVTQGCDLSYMVMERLGMSLEDFLEIRKRKISLSLIKHISLKLLRKIMLLHSVGIIHNDIKPSNILFGVGDNRKEIYLIDYGLASITSRADQRSSDLEASSAFRGNLPFASLGKLAGRYPSKSDDIQSLVYVVLWLLSGGRTQWVSINIPSQDQSCRCEVCNRCLQSKIKRHLAAKIQFLENYPLQRAQQTREEQSKRRLIQLLAVLNQKHYQQFQYQALLSRVQGYFLDLCE